MSDVNELVSVVFSGLSNLVADGVSDEGDVIRVSARPRDAPVPCPSCDCVHSGFPLDQVAPEPCCTWPARIEAPLLAQTLGITAGTAVRWSELAGRTYSGYVDRVARGEEVAKHS